MRRLLLAYALGLVPALALAAGQPVWSRVDEAAHYDVIAQYAAGVYPHDSVTTIRPETLAVMEQTGVFGFVVDGAYQYPDPETGFRTMPGGLSDAAHVLWIRRHGWQYSYEAFQPPLYYALALPAWKLGDAAGGPMGALYAVRVFDALLAALLAPLAMLIALRIWPGRTGAAWSAALLTAALPGVALNLTSVTNDVLVSVLGAACLLVAVSGEWTRGRVIALGVLFGAALLAKTTAAGLAPALAVALLQRSRGGGVRPLLGTASIAAVIVTPWIVSNLAIYGEVVTTREQLAMAAFPARTAALDFWSVSTLHAFVTFWTGDPFLSLPLAVPLALLAAFITALAVAGLVRAPRSGSLPVVALGAAGMALVSVTSPVLAAFEAPGRLAYAGVAAAMALVAGGLWLELRSARLRGAVVGGFAALALAGLGASTIHEAQPPVPSPPSVSGGGIELATGTFRGLRINEIACAVDPSGDLWLYIGFVNLAGTPVEWSQTAEIRSGDQTVATSDYRRSTHLPMAIPGNAVGGGWLYFGSASRLSGAKATSLVFRNLAAHDYQEVGDLSIPAALC